MQDHLIKRGARYSVRRKIPIDLQSHFGKREIVRALGTSDPAEGKRLARIADVSIDAEFAAARKSIAEAVAASAAASAHSALPTSAPDPERLTSAQIDDWEREQSDLQDEYDEYVASGEEARDLYAFTQQKLVMVAALHSLGYGPAAPLECSPATQLPTGLSEKPDGPANRTAARSSKSAPSATTVLYLTDIVTRWSIERTPDQRTIRIAEKVATRFTEHCGLLPISTITRRAVIDFKDKLLANGQTPVNTNKQLSLLGTLLNFASDNLLIDSNVAKGVRVADRKNPKAARVPFDLPALKAIFTSPVYSEGLRPAAAAGEAAYWLPLLALFTGARIEELAQLRPSDIYEETYHDALEQEQACFVLRITDAAEGQSLKNEGSRRRFPLHPALLSLGFPAFAAKQSKHARIFHQLKPDPLGVESANWSKWFGKYLRKVCKVSDPRMVFHSFRHTFKHAARESGMPEDIADAITGHAAGGVARRYGGLDYPLRPMVAAMSAYRIPGLSIPLPPPRVSLGTKLPTDRCGSQLIECQKTGTL